MVIMMPTLIWPSLVLLILFLMVAAIDGSYFHLQQHRLYARRESYFEHLLHTIRALLILPTLWLLFIFPAQGYLLYLTVALVLLDIAVMVMDALIEYRSRAGLGGLSRGEYTVHLIANSLHMMAITLAFASRPAASWQLVEHAASVAPPAVALIGKLLLAGATIAALHHLWLLYPRFNDNQRLQQ
jgi:hypothetical protein